MKVLSLVYSLAPEHKFPTQIHEVVSAYTYLVETLNFKPQNIVFSGESAGGGLVVASLLYIRDHFPNLPLPKCAVVMSPWLDMTMSSPSISTNSMKDYLVINPSMANLYCEREEHKTNHYASPIFGNPTGLCNFLVQVGDAEILRDESLLFAHTCKKFGVNTKLEIYPEMPHAFQIFSSHIPEANFAIENIIKYINNQFCK